MNFEDIESSLWYRYDGILLKAFRFDVETIKYVFHDVFNIYEFEQIYSLLF